MISKNFTRYFHFYIAIFVLAVSGILFYGRLDNTAIGAEEVTTVGGVESDGPKVDAARIARLVTIVTNGHRDRYKAIRELAMSKEPAAFDAISGQLAARSLTYRLEAVEALGVLGDRRGLPLLRKALQSRHTSMKLFSIIAIGKLGSAARPACGELGALLDRQFAKLHPQADHLHPDAYNLRNKDISVRIHLAVVSTLGHIGGDEAESVIAGVIKQPNLEVAAASALKEMNASDALLAAGKNCSQVALFRLAELGDNRCYPVIMSQLGDSKMSERDRSYLIIALGRLGNTKATPFLLKSLREKSERLCRSAAMSLNRLADPASLPGLVDYVSSTKIKSAGLYSATCAIGAVKSPESAAALRKLVNHPQPSVIEAVTYRISEQATEQDLPLLIKLVKASEDSLISNTLVEYLINILPSSGPPLLELLKTTGPKTQCSIINILSNYEPARPTIRQLLNSSNRFIRARAKRVLLEHRDPLAPLAEYFAAGESISVDQSDVPELERLVVGGNETQSYVAMVHLLKVNPELAWKYIRPRFYGNDQKIMEGCNLMRGKVQTDWGQNCILQMLEQREGLSVMARMRLLELLSEGENIPYISARAIKLCREICEEGDDGIDSWIPRCKAYQCFYQEASDESMQFLARKAIDGDIGARMCLAANYDDRLTSAFEILLKEATLKKDKWLSGYVHLWSHIPGIREYAILVNSDNLERLDAAIKLAKETAP